MKFKSPVYSQASGSIAGITYSHNRGGMYTRARAIPTDPQSPQQMAIRGFVAALTSLWNNVLTGPQRVAWDTYADAVTLLNPLGEPINIGGLAHYVRSNVPRLQNGYGRVDDGPVIFNLGEFTPITVDALTAATKHFNLNFTEADDWVEEDGAGMYIASSRSQNPSINYFKGPYRLLGGIAGNSVAPETTPFDGDAAFPIVVGNRTFFQVRVSRADGRLSLPFRVNGIGA